MMDAFGGAPTNLSGNATSNGSNALGRVDIAGTTGQSVEFYISNGTVSSGGNTANVTHITSSMSSPIYLNGGTKRVYLGGSVLYPASLPVGSYTGTATFYYRYTSGILAWKTTSINLLFEVQRTPISIQETQQLDFGKIITDPAGGKIAMDFSGNRTNLIGTSSFAGTSTVGAFLVSGQPNTLFTISGLPTSISPSNGVNTILLNNFRHNGGTSPQLDSAGKGKFNVTADLKYNAGRQGVYTGTYTVRTNY